MVGMNRAAFDGGEGGFDETRFVEGVGVNGHLDILLVGDAEAAINSRRCRPPILVELAADGAAQDLFRQSGRQRGVSFARETEVERQAVGGLEHHAKMMSAGRAGGGGGALRGRGGEREKEGGRSGRGRKNPPRRGGRWGGPHKTPPRAPPPPL